MVKNYTEKFTEEDDKVLYRRTYPQPDNKEAHVEIYLTKNYLTDTDNLTAACYINHAVAAILTRNGVEIDD